MTTDVDGNGPDGAVLAERLLQVIDEGRRVATYKLALLMALIDACATNSDERGAAPTELHTREIARHVLRLYFPHARAYLGVGRSEPVELRQISNQRSAVMNAFVRLGQKRLLVNERLMLFASEVVLTEFRGDTSIEESAMRDPDYALLLICDTESAVGETGMIELWHSIARDDYAIVVKGHDGREVLRDGFNSDLKDVVTTVSDLGLVLTQLHLAQASSQYCALARDLFLEALDTP